MDNYPCCPDHLYAVICRDLTCILFVFVFLPLILHAILFDAILFFYLHSSLSSFCPEVVNPENLLKCLVKKTYLFGSIFIPSVKMVLISPNT